ncbi:MAG: hypothetical protein ABR94_11630 [Sphingobacteriales bacterium BACL12 MAG-120802-bin5]|jgi:arylsulfate sulfotransferase|nr:MAG: hypothetical protein ABR94_11630 [Sphingobacteriales bacterium BACL12 MAG-120802-bin5]
MYKYAFLFLLSGLLILQSCRKDAAIGQRVDLANLAPEDLRVELNPNGNSPLSAALTFESIVPVRVSVRINGEHPLEHTFEDLETTHEHIIAGLYPGTDNEVDITLTDAIGNFASTTLTITTDPLPNYFPDIETNVITPLRQDGWTLTEFGVGLGTSFLSVPFIFDEAGKVRWFLELDVFSDLSFPVKQLPNGNMLVSYLDHIYEYDLLGNEINDIYIPGYFQHHETRIMPNGNYLLAVDKEGISTVEDHIIEISPNGTLVQEWDLREILDMDRYDLVEDPVDWFHNNAVWYSEDDDCLIISGRNQGVVKVTRNNELVWILAPHQGWGVAANGLDNSDWLLTAVDATGNAYPDEVQQGTTESPSFDWTWGQHAPMLLPNGNIFIFDNGFNRHFLPGEPSFSRAVEYRIDEAAMTVQQIWQYGKERGTECWAPIISDVDRLQNTNRIMHSGIVFGPTSYAKIIEVTFPDASVASEITLQFKNALSDGALAWGGLDLSYRSERIYLYPR